MDGFETAAPPLRPWEQRAQGRPAKPSTAASARPTKADAGTLAGDEEDTLDGREPTITDDAPEPSDFGTQAPKPNAFDLPEPGKRRTRGPNKNPPGEGPRRRSQAEKDAVEGISDLLCAGFGLVGSKYPIWELEKAEADKLALPLNNVLKYHRIHLDGDKGVYLALAFIVIIVFGPRFVAQIIELNNQRKALPIAPQETAIA